MSRIKLFLVGLIISVGLGLGLTAQSAEATHNGKGRICAPIQPHTTYVMPSTTHDMAVYEGPGVGMSYGPGYPGYFWSKTTRVTYHEWHANYGWTQNIVRWYWQGSPTMPNSKVLYQTTGGGIPVTVCYST